MPDRGLADDGRIYAPLSILFLDKDSWNEILDENELDRATYSDPDHPVAVALNGTQSNDGRRYSVRDLFTSTGTATLFTQIAPIEDSPFVEIGVDENGDPVARYEGYGDEGNPVRRIRRGAVPANSGPGRRARPEPQAPVKAIVKTLPKAVTSYASILADAHPPPPRSPRSPRLPRTSRQTSRRAASRHPSRSTPARDATATPCTPTSPLRPSSRDRLRRRWTR